MKIFGKSGINSKHRPKQNQMQFNWNRCVESGMKLHDCCCLLLMLVNSCALQYFSFSYLKLFFSVCFQFPTYSAFVSSIFDGFHLRIRYQGNKMPQIWQPQCVSAAPSPLTLVLTSPQTLPWSHPLLPQGTETSFSWSQTFSWSSSSSIPPFVQDKSACLDLITKLRRHDSLICSSGVSFWFLLQYLSVTCS